MNGQINNTALFNISYGLYAITCNDGVKDNALIANTAVQLTSTPLQVAVTLNKQDYSFDVIKKSGKMNVCCLSQSAPFSLIQKYGFHSGRDTDKFAGETPVRSENGLAYLKEYSNAFISLKVEQFVDLGTHGMFICLVTEAEKLSNELTMTYSFYQSDVKPKPAPAKKKGFVCKICGYVYEGDTLPDDFVCPICKHPASDFEEIK